VLVRGTPRQVHEGHDSSFRNGLGPGTGAGAQALGFRLNRFAEGRGFMVWRRFFGRPELTGVEARQGYLDRPVLVVLVISTCLALVVLGSLLLQHA
jgi:hypothetical protein